MSRPLTITNTFHFVVITMLILSIDHAQARLPEEEKGSPNLVIIIVTTATGSVVLGECEVIMPISLNVKSSNTCNTWKFYTVITSDTIVSYSFDTLLVNGIFEITLYQTPPHTSPQLP